MSHDPNVELWRAVIRQAITDATSPLSQRKGVRLDQIRAREWFTKPNRDFEETCQLADMDPDHVRNRVIPLIAKADLAPPRPAHCPAKRYEYQGRSLTLTEWAAETGIDRATLYSRITNGMSIEAAITMPYRKRKRMHRGAAQSILKSANDRATPVAQDSV
jgi:hypothetical protein